MKRLDFFKYKKEYGDGYLFALKFNRYGKQAYIEELYGTGFDVQVIIFDHIFGVTVKLTLPKAGEACE